MVGAPKCRINLENRKAVAAMIKAHIQTNWGVICFAPHSSDLYHAGGSH